MPHTPLQTESLEPRAAPSDAVFTAAWGTGLLGSTAFASAGHDPAESQLVAQNAPLLDGRLGIDELPQGTSGGSIQQPAAKAPSSEEQSNAENPALQNASGDAHSPSPGDTLTTLVGVDLGGLRAGLSIAELPINEAAQGGGTGGGGGVDASVGEGVASRLGGGDARVATLQDASGGVGPTTENVLPPALSVGGDDLGDSWSGAVSANEIARSLSGSGAAAGELV